MIPFKMKILSYNPSGSYSVEYSPDNEKCTTVKLEINIDSTIDNQEQILNLLKTSSPQDYWKTELASNNVDRHTLQELVNTVHTVNNFSSAPASNAVTGFSSPSTFANAPQVNVPEYVNPTNTGFTPNEQVASRNSQDIVRLKVIIQQVIKEMAEGTV
jgi:hypothetical protein